MKNTQNKPIPLTGTSLGKGRNSAFTLVELIIVITILAILATIGFMSFQSYTIDARDSSRITSLKTMSDGLQIYQAKNSKLPDPDPQTVTIMSGGLTISTQGYAGISVLQKLRASDIKDPSDNTYYTYAVNSDKTKYQLLSMLEKDSSLAMNNNLLNEAYARTDYTSRYAYTIGNKVGIFFSGSTNNTPIQETMSGNLDLTISPNSTKLFKVIFSNEKANSGTIISTGANLPSQIQTITNTTAIAQANPGVKTTGFSTTLYTGNGGNQSITSGVDMSSQWGTTSTETYGGLLWIKSRSYAAGNRLFDSIRPLGYAVYSDLTNTESNDAGLTGFNTNGFNIAVGGGGTNQNSSTYTSWNFQTTHRTTGTTNHGKTYTCHYNPYTGFTIVKYDGSGTAGHEIPNCLGRKLDFVVVKRLNVSRVDWYTYDSFNGAGKYMYLNSTSPINTSGLLWAGNTNTTINLTANSENAATTTNILYGWSNSYYDASSNLVGNYEIGTYNGTGVSGNKITTRGKPAWVMTKRIDSTSEWVIVDNKRGGTSSIEAQSSAAETSFYQVGMQSDGFVLNSAYSTHNASGGQFLYMLVYDNDNGSGKSTYMLK